MIFNRENLMIHGTYKNKHGEFNDNSLCSSMSWLINLGSCDLIIWMIVADTGC